MNDSKQLRIVYMGTPAFAVSTLQQLIEQGYNVVAVVTTPDKPAGRGLKVQESAVKRYAQALGIPVLQPIKMKDPEFVAAFEALRADLGIVIAFRMLPEIIWAQPRLGTFNLHASLLPQYRGAAPINRAIINGETETGVTTFLLNHEIDKGDLLAQRRIAISPEDNAGSLHDKLMEAGSSLVIETVEKIARGEISPLPQPQNDGELRGAPKIFKEDCKIDWNRSCREIHNLIRGLSPYPGAWTPLLKADAPESAIKIFKAVPEKSQHNLAPGTILSDNKTYLKVACADGYLLFTDLQLSGKRRMQTDELLRGFKQIDTFRCNDPYSIAT